METQKVSTPAQDRYRKSYEIRRAFVDEIQKPLHTVGVEGAIDIHCHAAHGNQDALAVSQHASRCKMGGLLYKTLPGKSPATSLKKIKEELARWSEAEGVKAIDCWTGHITGRTSQGLSLAEVQSELTLGAVAVWMPVALHANTLIKIGGRKIKWHPEADRNEVLLPTSWEEALELGHYLLEGGKLKPIVQDIISAVVDHDAALFFGHATHSEIFALAEEMQKRGIKKAVVDHPFSPFVDLTVDQMKQLADGGIFLNFTYDELSPLLAVDPHQMYQAIRAIGTKQVTLSSDAGEPLFPNSVECMRLMRAYMRAFGLTAEEIKEVTETNPAKILQ